MARPSKQNIIEIDTTVRPPEKEVKSEAILSKQQVIQEFGYVIASCEEALQGPIVYNYLSAIIRTLRQMRDDLTVSPFVEQAMRQSRANAPGRLATDDIDLQNIELGHRIFAVMNHYLSVPNKQY